MQLADGSSVHGLVNLPAVLILCLISLLLMRGVRESTRVNGVIVVVKVAVVLAVVGVGLFYVKAQNYVPFIPENTGTFGEYGWSGIMRAAAWCSSPISASTRSRRRRRRSRTRSAR